MTEKEQQRFDDLERGFRELLSAVQGATLPHSYLNRTLVDIGRQYCPHPSFATVFVVYGKTFEDLVVPKGFALSIMEDGKPEFRLVSQGDWWLDPLTGEALYAGSPWACSQNSYLILRKLKRLVFDVIDENRVAHPGEWYKEPGEWVSINKAYVTSELRGKMYLILSEPRIEE